MADDDTRGRRPTGRDRKSRNEARAPASGGKPSVKKEPPRALPSDPLEVAHQIVEDEARHGEVPVAPDPDQKGEPGSSV